VGVVCGMGISVKLYSYNISQAFSPTTRIFVHREFFRWIFSEVATLSTAGLSTLLSRSGEYFSSPSIVSGSPTVVSATPSHPISFAIRNCFVMFM